jgi:Flp pilus assembly pilin Flp
MVGRIRHLRADQRGQSLVEVVVLVVGVALMLTVASSVVRPALERQFGMASNSLPTPEPADAPAGVPLPAQRKSATTGLDSIPTKWVIFGGVLIIASTWLILKLWS